MDQTYQCLSLVDLMVFFTRYFDSFEYASGVFKLISSEGRIFFWEWNEVYKVYCIAPQEAL